MESSLSETVDLADDLVRLAGGVHAAANRWEWLRVRPVWAGSPRHTVSEALLLGFVVSRA